MVLAGSDLLNKLSIFPERFQFHVNSRWRISIKGGERHPEPISDNDLERIANDAEFSMEMAKKIAGD